MKYEVECGVIHDLLPLYEDGAASEETTQLVREHLKDCPVCREELRKMRVLNSGGKRTLEPPVFCSC